MSDRSGRRPRGRSLFAEYWTGRVGHGTPLWYRLTTLAALLVFVTTGLAAGAGPWVAVAGTIVGVVVVQLVIASLVRRH